jgi:hypothetical protein
MKEQVLPNALKTRYRTTIFPFYDFLKSKSLSFKIWGILWWLVTQMLQWNI